MIASDNIALLVHTQAAVSITIVGKANIQALLHNKLLKTLNVGRACVVVDVRAIRLIIDDVGVSTQSIENALSDIPAGTIGAVQADLDTFEGIDTQRDQITHVTVASGHIIHSAADMLTMSERQLRPVLVKYMELAIDVVLYQQQRFFRHLLAVAVDQFDAVVGVVAGGDHNAAVKVIHTGNVGHGRSGGDMEQISICTGSSQTSHQTIFKHIGAATRILTDDDTGRLFISVALTESIIIPAEETPHLVGVVGC